MPAKRSAFVPRTRRASRRAPIPRIDRSWTLFLDRDGVLNAKIEGGYVLRPSMLQILPGVASAIALLSRLFGRIVVLTNQRGIARGLMTTEDLADVHAALLARIAAAGGRIDAIFVCPHGLDDGCNCRKPRIGLALQARKQFPEIDFSRSILVGDSDSDIRMGMTAGMFTVRIGDEGSSERAWTCRSLLDFARKVEITVWRTKSSDGT
jgi:D-glycero-D-manno-heptose 1,7-bisphosphate phosphatase